MPRPLLLGHRGARATRSIPENTFASFDLALEHGCDGFEFDVRLTADSVAVICHDPEFAGVNIARAESSHTPALPRLDDLLARYAASAFLDIELKVAGLEPLVLAGLKTNPPQRGFVISSFLPGVLASLRALDPGTPLGLLCEDKSQLSRWKTSPAQFVVPHFAFIDDDLCKQVHSAGKKILTWTVNDRESMQRLSAWRVDGIISDDTSLLVEVLGRKSG